MKTQPWIWKRRQCKKCMQPYSIWSLNRAIGSGMCASCTNAHKPVRRDAVSEIYAMPINSKVQAVRIIRFTAICYFCLGLLNFIIIGDDPYDWIVPVSLLIASVALICGKSRVAAIFLLCAAVIATITLVVTCLASKNSPSFSLVMMMINGIQVAVTVKCVEATFKVHGPFQRWQRSKPPAEG